MLDANGTHYSQMFYTKMWIDISQHIKKDRDCNGNFITNDWISAFILPVNASFTTSQLSIFMLSYLFKIHFLEVFFSDTRMDAFKHTLYTQKVFQYIYGLLPAWAAPFPLHWCAVQHCLHHNFSCRSHYLPRYCIYSNFFPSFILSVSQLIFYNSSRVVIISSSSNWQPSKFPITLIPILCFLGLSYKSRSSSYQSRMLLQSVILHFDDFIIKNVVPFLCCFLLNLFLRYFQR